MTTTTALILVVCNLAIVACNWVIYREAKAQDDARFAADMAKLRP